MSYVYFNPNPTNKDVGDCVVRAFAAATDKYGNVTSTAIITVPRGCCFNISVEAVDGTTEVGATPAPQINVINSNLTITRIA